MDIEIHVVDGDGNTLYHAFCRMFWLFNIQERNLILFFVVIIIYIDLLHSS